MYKLFYELFHIFWSQLFREPNKVEHLKLVSTGLFKTMPRPVSPIYSAYSTYL
jgi:hypothetical protein